MNSLSLITSFLSEDIRNQPVVKVLAGTGEILVSSISLLTLLNSRRLSPLKLATDLILVGSIVNGVVTIYEGFEKLNEVSSNELYNRTTP